MTRSALVNQAAFDAYIDQCEAENWEVALFSTGETIFPFQRPPVEMVARLYELSGNDVEVMISALQQYRGEGSFPDPERRVHSAGFHDVDL